MLSPKFFLRAVAFLVISIWAQYAAALTCPSYTGSAGNPAAEFFANATEDACQSTSFAGDQPKTGILSRWSKMA